MIEGMCGFAGRIFPSRRLLLCGSGRVRSISLPGWLQAIALVAALGGIGGVGTLIAGYIHVERALHHQTARVASLVQHVVSNASATNDDLRRQLADANDRAEALSARVARTSAKLDEARQLLGELNLRLAAANSQREALKGSLSAAEAHAKSLDAARVDLQHQLQAALANSAATRTAEMERNTLRTRLNEREKELQDADARSAQLKAAVDAMDNQLLEMAFERDRLRAQLGEPPDRVANPPDNTTAQAEPTRAGTGKTKTASAGPQPAGKSRPASTTSALERLIASTGVDIDKILGGLSLPSGEGGPYVALNSVKRGPVEDAKRIAELRRLVKTLPLGSPLVHYQLESGFGPRIDPINGHEAFHPGLDLAAPYRSPVYSTGPGVVIFTGVMGDYGRVVEINHGHGIVTRYAHLHRILVARGQRVAMHQEIGELGSTGRSTGPHVHYEILVNGTPQDPEKFMEAGKNVIQVTAKK